MNLNKNSWHFNLYKLWWRCEPNNNFCDYFWALVFILVTLPFFIGWMAYSIFHNSGLLDNRPETRTFVSKSWYYIVNTILILLVSFLIGLAIPWIIIEWKLALAVTLAVVIFFFVIYLFITIKDSASTSETVQIIQTKIKSKKENYCPKITWRN